jgi:hypothetical protein
MEQPWGRRPEEEEEKEEKQKSNGRHCSDGEDEEISVSERERERDVGESALTETVFAWLGLIQRSSMLCL